MILNNWKEIEEMLTKEVKSRFDLGYINKVGFNNAIDQLNEIRSEISKTEGAKEAIYGEGKIPNLPALKIVSEREKEILGSKGEAKAQTVLSINNLKINNDSQPRIKSSKSKEPSTPKEHSPTNTKSPNISR